MDRNASMYRLRGLSGKFGIAIASDMLSMRLETRANKSRETGSCCVAFTSFRPAAAPRCASPLQLIPRLAYRLIASEQSQGCNVHVCEYV